MKRKVKNWLKIHLGKEFKDFRIVVDSNHNDKHQTYCVPTRLVAGFKEWAKIEMKEMGIL
jgi:hypothetical protein